MLLGALTAGPASAQPPAPTDKLDAAVAAVASAEPGERRDVASANALEVRGGRVVVELRARRARTADAIERVRDLGGRVGSSVPGIVEAFVPPAALADLARMPSVTRLGATAPRSLDAVTGQGVADTGANAAHAAGIDGTGVKVGVVDAGFGGLGTAIASGELPGNVQTLNLCSNISSSTHGTAVSEIVHEMAPGARMLLICTDTSADLPAAVQALLDQGVRVVNESLSYYQSSRGDGSGGPGTPDDAVERARAAGIFWANSAGNSAMQHWSGKYNPGTGSTGRHDWTAGDEGNNVTIPVGARDCFHLKWDSWPVTSQNFNLRLETSGGAFVVQTTEVEDGNDPPVESLCYTNPGPGTGFQLVVTRIAPTSTTPRLDLFSPDASLEHRVAAGSVTEPGSAPEAVAIGAYCFATHALQPYSSQGPTIDGRRKPDLSGPDRVSTTTRGPFTTCTSGSFGGTSASSPHAAGAAALLLQGSTAGPARVQQALQSSARDFGPAGPDNGFGVGGIRLAPGQPDLVIDGVGDDTLSANPAEQQASAKLKVKKRGKSKRRLARAAKRKPTARFQIALQDDGPLLGPFELFGDPGTRRLKVTYLDGDGVDVTEQLATGLYMPRVGLGEQVGLTMVVQPKRKARRGKTTFNLDVVNSLSPNLADSASVRVKVKVKKKKKGGRHKRR